MTHTVGAIDAWAILVQPGAMFISIFKGYGRSHSFDHRMTTEEIIDSTGAARVGLLMPSAFAYGEYLITRNDEVAIRTGGPAR